MEPDPFEALGLPARFDLSPAEIERAYLVRSAAVHPDVARGDAEAARTMAALNEARRVLGDPERRADALVRRLGGPSREREKGLPSAFLAEIMDTRTAIEEAMAIEDPAARDSARARWEAWATGERARAIAEVGALFAGLPSPPSDGALRAIRVRLNAWRYLERLIEQLDPAAHPGGAGPV